MPLIVILATGGTISSREQAGGSVATDSAETLLAGADAVAPGLRIEAIDVLRKNSFNLDMADLRTIAIAIDTQLARDDVDGIVVTHGTDTMEETAFLADLVHRDPRPVVFTGSQLGADDPASDGPRNLQQAITVAASPRSRGIGVVISFAGNIFAARGTRKVHSLAMAPFGAQGAGPIGHAVGRDLSYHARPIRDQQFAIPSDRFSAVRVDTVLSYPGADDALFQASVDAGARGIVVVGTGSGNANDTFVSAIGRATKRGIIVGLGSRVGDGPIVPIYGNGGAVDAVAAGAIPLGLLPASQARVLIAVLLDRLDPEASASALREYCSRSATQSLVHEHT